MRQFVRASFAALALASVIVLPARAQEKDIVDTAVGPARSRRSQLRSRKPASSRR